MKYDVFSAYICALIDSGVVNVEGIKGFTHGTNTFDVFECGVNDVKVITKDATVVDISSVHYNKSEDRIEIFGRVVWDYWDRETEGYTFL